MAGERIICFLCRLPVPGYVEGLGHHIQWHIQKEHVLAETLLYNCTFPRCRMQYQHFGSLKRHIRKKHPPAFKSQETSNYSDELDELSSDAQDFVPIESKNKNATYTTLADIKQIIAMSICRLTANVGIPHNKVLESVRICENIVNHVSKYLEELTESFLRKNGIDMNSKPTIDLLNEFKTLELFESVRTYRKQQIFLKSLAVNVPQPSPKCIGSRDVVRCVDGVNKTVRINDTFMYIPIIQTLKLLFRNPATRSLLIQEGNFNQSTPGVKEYSSSCTGLSYEKNDYFKKYPYAIRLSLYQDDVEIGNAFSSRAGKNKISNFCIKVQNFPPQWNSSPKTIFPVTYALSSQIKQYGYSKILQSLILDLKKLEEGVIVFYGDEKFELRATVTVFCGDTLAAHEVFGLLGPGATYFCRICTLARPLFHENPTAQFPCRTVDWYNNKLQGVRNGEIKPSECGIKATGCILNELQNFHVTQNYALDTMHDLAEGVIPLAIQLTLSFFYKQKDIQINKEVINNRIAFFHYGYVDRKNRPSPNITEDMLSAPQKHKMRQTASQHFLLLRAFPFLFGDLIPKDSKHMIMIGHLINITRILSSPVVSDDMLIWLNEHIRLFQDIFFSTFDKRINKLHHLSHYEECIRQSGSMKQFNCLPFEQKNKPLKNQAATCRNYKNICKSLAERQTFHTVLEILDNPLRDHMMYKSGPIIHKNGTLSGPYLGENVQLVYSPTSIILNGVEFRKNLLVAMKSNRNEFFPEYGIIQELISSDDGIYVLLRLCDTILYNEVLQSYEVHITTIDQLFDIDEVFQHTTFAIWKAFGNSSKYVSRRYYNRDY